MAQRSSRLPTNGRGCETVVGTARIVGAPRYFGTE
jgi:hypothetical protein